MYALAHHALLADRSELSNTRGGRHPPLGTHTTTSLASDCVGRTRPSGRSGEQCDAHRAPSERGWVRRQANRLGAGRTGTEDLWKGSAYRRAEHFRSRTAPPHTGSASSRSAMGHGRDSEGWHNGRRRDRRITERSRLHSHETLGTVFASERCPLLPSARRRRGIIGWVKRCALEMAAERSSERSLFLRLEGTGCTALVLGTRARENLSARALASRDEAR